MIFKDNLVYEEAVCAAPLAYPTGQRVVYSDLGLILVGEAITRLMGSSLAEVVKVWVVDPLGLTQTTYLPLIYDVPVSVIVPTEFCSWRRRRLRGEVHDENAAGLGGISGHAGLFSVALEVAALGEIYLNGRAVAV